MSALGRLLRVDTGFSRCDLEAFLDEARSNWIPSRGKGGEALMLMMSELACREAQNDREAELVRRGIRLGLYLASYHREAYANAVARARQIAGRETLTNKLARYNKAMAEDYRRLKVERGCLGARREIRDNPERYGRTRKLTLQRINQILAAQGVTLGDGT